MPVNARADIIRLSPDGKTVYVPVAQFRAREADLQLLDLLKKQNDEKANTIAVLIAQIEKERILRDQERKAADALYISLRGDVAKAKSTYGLLGFIAGGLAVGLAK